MIEYQLVRFEGRLFTEEFVKFLNDWGLMDFDLMSSNEIQMAPLWEQMDETEKQMSLSGQQIRRHFVDCVFRKKT